MAIKLPSLGTDPSPYNEYPFRGYSAFSSHFTMNLPNNIRSDSYVKIEVLSSRGKRVAKSKTTIRRSMTNPEFNESFVFQMSESDLHEVTLVFSVISISKTRKKKEILGWFTMGKEANGLDEIDHWEEMVATKEQKSTHFHVLSQA